MGTGTAPRTIDAVTLEVLRNCFIQICEEVTITMLKTAHSVIFNEGKDLSTAVFDRRGRLVAQDVQGCPIHIAAMPQAVRAGIEQYGIENIHPGDVLMINDAYAGGTHLPDVTIFAPVHWEGELVGFVGNRGHHSDIGGMSPGSMPGDATEMYQEGLILPAVKLYARGEPCRDVWSILRANVRLERHTEGDVAAQRAGVQTGIRRFESLLERYGPELVETAIDEILDYSERHMRAEIARIPDGTYTFEDFMDPDAATGRPVRIQVTVRKRDSEIEFDFDGSDPQVGGAVNAVLGVTKAAVWIAMMMVTDPNIHPSDGAFRPVTVRAPEGTVVNPRPPAATVSGLTETCPRIVDLCVAALAPGSPDRVVAGGTGSCNVYTFSGTPSATPDGPAERWVAVLNPKGGWGGMEERDGWTCIQEPHSNCRNQPCESLEHAFPLRVRRYALRTGEEGAGRHRGGYGLVRDIEVREPCLLSTCIDRSAIAPFGLFDGRDGSCNRMWVRRAGGAAWEPLPSRRSNVALAAGDVVRIETAIGGGYGDPLARDPLLVAEDMADGYVPAEAAEAVYGVVLGADGPDVGATERLRERRRAAAAARDTPTAPSPAAVARRPRFDPA